MLPEHFHYSWASKLNIALVGSDVQINYAGIPIPSLGAGLSDSSVTGTHLIQGNETSLAEEEIGQSDQVGNVLFEVDLHYNTLLKL